MKSLEEAIKGDLSTVFYSSGVGASRLRATGSKYFEIACDEPAMKEMLERERPDVVVTSATSIASQNPGEGFLWKLCKELEIPSVAFLDQWQNYRMRFSADGRSLDTLPDWINAIDATGRKEMISEGFAPEMLKEWGHPYLDFFTKKLRKLIAIEPRGGQRVILFVSEPIKEFFQASRGYDQFTAFDYFLKIIANTMSPDSCRILVKLHPKEIQSAYFEEALHNFKFQYRILGAEVLPEEALLGADEVYGMTSILLIQAYLLGLPTYSVQPNLSGIDPLVISRQGLIKRLGSEGNLKEPGARLNLDHNFKKIEFLNFIKGLN